MTSGAPLPALASLRRRLTAWYAATFGLILLLLGGGLYAAIHAQLTRQLQASMREATKELASAARIREIEAASAHGTVVDAVDELHIPDRALFLFDTTGRLVRPDSGASAWIRAGALRAASAGAFDDTRVEREQRSLFLHAERFRLPSGRAMIAVAVADEIELADRFASLIAAFGVASVAAVLLLLAGGYLLVQKSTEPVERSMTYTRRFMADAAHELRTPIAVLRTRSEVALQSARSPESYTATLRGINMEAQRLGRVVDDLLTLARADAGERPVARESFFLDDVVIDAALSVRTLAQADGVTLVVDQFEETPMVGDPALVRELAVVLLDNAVKFTPAGGTVRVAVELRPEPTLVVTDTGPGIPDDQLGFVFERFYRGDAARPRTGGAGLGLSIAQWIASVHGARVELSRAPEGGTRAQVSFARPSAVG